MKKTLLASAILSVLSFGALAETPSFNYLDVGFSSYDLDVLDAFNIDPLTGFEIKGSKEINDNFYIAGDHTDVSEAGLDLTLTTLGFGYKNDFSSTSSFFAELDYATSEVSGGSDEDGYEITFGIRSMVTEQLELKAAAEYLDIDGEDTTSLVLGTAYNLTDSVALYADYKYESDLSRYGVGLRFNF